MLDTRANELRELRNTGELTDIRVIVDKAEFELHKFPLYLNSEFFRALCRSAMVDQHRVTLSHFPGGAATFSLVADYCYGKDIAFDRTNVVSLRCAAEFLQMISPGNLADEASLALWRILRPDDPHESVSEIAHVLTQCCGFGEIASQTHVVSTCFAALLEVWTGQDDVPDAILEVVMQLPVAWFVTFIVAARDHGQVCHETITRLAIKYLKSVLSERSRTIAEYLRRENTTDNGDKASPGRPEEFTDDDNDIGEIIDLILSELPENTTLCGENTDFICLLYKLATTLGCKCEDMLLRAVTNILSNISAVTLATMTLAHISAIAEHVIESDAFPPEVLCHTIDTYLGERVRRKTIDVDEFVAVSRILPKDYRDEHDSLLRLAEEFFATTELSDETKNEVLSFIEADRLHEETLTLASERKLVPSEFIVSAALSVSSRLRHELTEARSELEDSKKAIDDLHRSVADVIKGQWTNDDVIVSVIPKNADSTKVSFTKIWAHNSSSDLALLKQQELEGKLTLCVRPARKSATQNLFLFDPFNTQLVELKRSTYNTLIVGESYEKKHTTSYWPFNDVS